MDLLDSAVEGLSYFCVMFVLFHVDAGEFSRAELSG